MSVYGNDRNVRAKRDDSLAVYRYLVDHGFVSLQECAHFMQSPFMLGYVDLLHVNMLYRWLQKDFGPIDDACVSFLAIQHDWFKLARLFPFTPYGSIGRFICNQEFEFWKQVAPKSASKGPLIIEID